MWCSSVLCGVVVCCAVVVHVDPQGVLHRPDNSRSSVDCVRGRDMGGSSENQGL